MVKIIATRGCGTIYYRCLHRGFLEDGSKCDFRVNLNQDKFNKHVETAIKLLVKNDSLREYIEMRMEEKADVSRLEEELSRTKEQLTQSKAAKDRLIDNISNLDSNDKHYNRKMEDMQERCLQTSDTYDKKCSTLLQYKFR